MRRIAFILLILLLAACKKSPAETQLSKSESSVAIADVVDAAASEVSAPQTDATASTAKPENAQTGEDARLSWAPPELNLGKNDIIKARRDAAAALKAGHLYEQPDDAIPQYLALLQFNEKDGVAKRGLAQSMKALLAQGDTALKTAEDDPETLLQAWNIASVLQAVIPDDKRTAHYLERVRLAEQLTQLNITGERQLKQGLLGEEGGEGAISTFRSVLKLKPEQPRALRGLVAAESALIRRAEGAAQAGNFEASARWMTFASQVREGAPSIQEAYAQIEQERVRQLTELRDAGVAALAAPINLKVAHEKLVAAQKISKLGDTAVPDLQERIELATRYGLFRPGQTFADALKEHGGQGPVMIVVPHGTFKMGADEADNSASDAEKPAHDVHFERGFAVSRTQVTVGEYRRFVQATNYRSRAKRRGNSIVYDERSGNFVRHSNVDWESGYDGGKAADDMPVLHVSVRDAEAYADWLSKQTGQSYRLPSEAEFEYILRAGSTGLYPWGNQQPSYQVGNLTGSEDVSPSGRRWSNAFAKYGDGWWGTSPVAAFQPNAWGLYDVGSNVSEWVADCWHASFRRAPSDGMAWFNPGCRARVIRGGSWASAPERARASWRAAQDSDMTNARVGFRVIRGI